MVSLYVQKPDHVPNEFVYDFDIYNDAELLRRPFDRIKDIACNAPSMFWTPSNNGHWIVSSYALIREISNLPEIFSNSYEDQRNVLQELAKNGSERVPIPVPIMLDPPIHSLYRGPLQKAFSPKNILLLEDKIRCLATSILDSIQDKGFCDVMEDIAIPLPVQIFLEIIGLPSDKTSYFRSLVKSHLKEPEYNFEQAGKKRRLIIDALRPALLDKIQGEKNDVIASLWRQKIGDRPTSLNDIENYSILLFIAGLDTVLNGLGHGIHFLAQHQDIQKTLRDNPKLIPSAVEEMLRIRGFTVPPPRRVSRDYELSGVTLKRGDIVHLFIPGANLDPTKFNNPHEFQLERPNNAHIVFNVGPHRCLGSHLARLEMRICYETLLRKIPQFELEPGFTPQYNSGHVIGLHNLHIKW